MIISWLLCQHIAGQGVGWQLPAEIAGIYGVFEVNDLAPGASGRDCIWDFSGAETLCLHKATVAAEDSLIALSFMRNIYRFRTDGEVIRCYCHENRLTKLCDSIGFPVMYMPLAYGDSISGNIDMSGRYSTDTRCMETGTVSHRAEACGTLILPDDTIRNVLRVKTEIRTKTLIADTVSRAVFDAVADSLPEFVQTDYCWYSERFALPVAWRSDMKLVQADSTVWVSSQSFILEPAYLSEHVHDGRRTPWSEGDGLSEKQSVGNVTINAQANGSIEIQYRLGREVTVLETTVCDLAGRVCYHSKCCDTGFGYHTETINMTGAPSGRYLLVVTGDDETIVRQLFEL